MTTARLAPVGSARPWRRHCVPADASGAANDSAGMRFAVVRYYLTPRRSRGSIDTSTATRRPPAYYIIDADDEVMVKIIHQTKDWLNAAACAAHYGRYYVGGCPLCTARVEEWAALLFRTGGQGKLHVLIICFRLSAAPVNVEEDEKVVNTDFF